MSWESTKNIVQMPTGNFRSIIGYAGESLAIGRALLCGYNLFFKAWRDAKYDAVLDANGTLYRLEIKQTCGTTSLSTSSGGRSGEQIDRNVASREATLSIEDCDYILGIQSLNGTCWIIPTEIVEILKIKDLKFYFLSHFEEKWGIFMFSHQNICNTLIKKGFSTLSDIELDSICSSLGLVVPPELIIQIGQRTKVTLTPRNWKIINIWLFIYDSL